jgi:hypothetical protein
MINVDQIYYKANFSGSLIFLTNQMAAGLQRLFAGISLMFGTLSSRFRSRQAAPVCNEHHINIL